MAYCNLYIQSRDHYDLDNGSTHGLCKPHMPHAWIVISEHLVNNAVDFNHFFKKTFLMMFIIYYALFNITQRSRLYKLQGQN